MEKTLLAYFIKDYKNKLKEQQWTSRNTITVSQFFNPKTIKNQLITKTKQ